MKRIWSLTQKIAKNARVLASSPKKRRHYLNYLKTKLVQGYATAEIPLECRIQVSSFSEYLSILNLLPNHAELKFMSQCLKGKSVALDVGANVGSWSVLMSKLNPSGRVYSFEPIPVTFDALKSNATLNGLQYHPVQTAVANEDAVLDFEVPGNVSIFGRLAPCRDSAKDDGRFKSASIIQVQAVRLDGFCERQAIDQIDFLKIDVEGFELAALQGLGRFLTDRKVKAIHMETIRENHERAGKSFENLLTFVRQCGYSFYLLDSDGVPSRKIPIHSLVAHNHVCIPD